MKTALLACLAALGLFAAGCVVRTGSYPIEVYTEQHYAQSYRSQEPPRIPPAPEAVAFNAVGSERVLEVSARKERPYDRKLAADLYRVNCSVCHGLQGLGDGPVRPHLTSPESFHASKTGQPYAPPPNLQESRQRLNEDAVFTIITNGIVVMPRFGLLLTEEERWDLVRYLFDTQGGLGR